MKKLETNSIMSLKGYDKLSNDRRGLLNQLSVAISNHINCWDDSDEDIESEFGSVLNQSAEAAKGK